MIRLTLETPDMYKNTRVYEDCVFCKRSCTTWHKRTNNPVCPDCAKNRLVSELTDHGRYLRNMERRKKYTNKS